MCFICVRVLSNFSVMVYSRNKVSAFDLCERQPPASDALFAKHPLFMHQAVRMVKGTVPF